MEISLGTFIKFLILTLVKRGVTLPFNNHEPWHRLFYELKELRSIARKPNFFKELVFEWDGPYPKLLRLSEFLDGLVRAGVVMYKSPGFKDCVLEKNVLTLWMHDYRRLDCTTKQFLIIAADLAEEEFKKTPA